MSSVLPALVARDTEEGREFLQIRLSLLARVATLLTLGFGFLGGVVLALADFSQGPWQWESTLAHLSGALVFGPIWLYTRRGIISPSRLAALDLLLVLTTACSFLAMGWPMPIGARPELLALFGITEALSARAVLVPSTPRRTGIYGSICILPLVVFAYFFYRFRSPPGFHPGPGTYAYATAVLGASVVVVSVIASRVTYGLQAKAREAMQLGQYTLVEKIGEGGMGVVYRAKHAMLRRPTAIKLLPPEKAGEHNLVRFEREAQLTSALNHPNTVHVYDFGRTPEGVFYYAMEYLDGLDLETLVEHDGLQEPARVVHLMVQICGALAEAHAVGLVHRDIKPSNVILCERAAVADVAKVVDFGLVKSFAPQDGGTQLSAVGQIVGTPAYLSPEAITNGDNIGPPSDLYAVGAVAYFLLTGTPVFEAETVVEVCSHHLHSRPVPPSERVGYAFPQALEQLILSCLKKAPSERAKSALELQEAFAACAAQGLVWSPEQARRWWSSRGHDLREKARSQRSDFGRSPGFRTIAVDVDGRLGNAEKASGARSQKTPKTILATAQRR